MKIALIGSAPSSVRLAPYNDASWKIWGCSPGAYGVVGRADEWFELHRWEPPVLGKPNEQVPWFSPEYVGWMHQHRCVWVADETAMLPNARLVPMDELVMKYGHYFLTSSIAWMFAMAIERILDERAVRSLQDQQALEADPHAVLPQREQDAIGMWGVDMAATEEYGYQRAGCQFFVQIANALGIQIVVPPESDLLNPPPMYGAGEISRRAIKLLARKRELQGRLAQAKNILAQTQHQVAMLEGAIDDNDYHIQMWSHEGADVMGTDFKRLFATPSGT